MTPRNPTKFLDSGSHSGKPHGECAMEKVCLGLYSIAPHLLSDLVHDLVESGQVVASLSCLPWEIVNMVVDTNDSLPKHERQRMPWKRVAACIYQGDADAHSPLKEIAHEIWQEWKKNHVLILQQATFGHEDEFADRIIDLLNEMFDKYEKELVDAGVKNDLVDLELELTEWVDSLPDGI